LSTILFGFINIRIFLSKNKKKKSPAMVYGAYKKGSKMATHLLAKATLQTSADEIWIEEYSISLHEIVVALSCRI
jgi:hypothetical protein